MPVGEVGLEHRGMKRKNCLGLSVREFEETQPVPIGHMRIVRPCQEQCLFKATHGWQR